MFTPEFKREATQLSPQANKLVLQVAAEMGWSEKLVPFFVPGMLQL